MTGTASRASIGYRARNAMRRLLVGLPLRGADVIVAALPTNVYQAHLSLYRFAARRARGRAVLDLGCGTGYGLGELLAAGAAAVTACERRPRLRAYARRHVRDPRARILGSFDELSPADDFDLALAIDVLPYLMAPGEVLAAMRRRMRAGGELVAALPPILDGQARSQFVATSRPASPLFLWEWQDLLSREVGTPRLFRHSPPAGLTLDLGDPRPSSLSPDDFRFEALQLSEIDDVGSLGAVYVCTVA